MIDLHTHILPGIDDGATDVAQSAALLRLQFQQGVSRLALTPHFYPQQVSLETFLKGRDEAFGKIQEIWSVGEMPELKLGAEVHYSPELIGMDLSKLTLGDSRYLLLELPYRRFPTHLEAVTRDLVMMGYTPILAHLERYPYFAKDPNLIAPYIRLGAMGQINAESLLDSGSRSFAKACLKHSLAHILASDTHDPKDRPPCLQAGAKELSEEEREQIQRYSEMVWNNEYPPFLEPSRVKKFMGRYY